MHIDWKRKLSSRKFWAMVAGVISGWIVFAASEKGSPERIIGPIESTCSLIAYIFGEAIADGGNHSADAGNTVGSDETEGAA